MLKKRLIGVITVLEGRAVQSFGYRRHLPLGTPECLAENLDRWGVDEILVSCIDRTRRGLGPDFDVVRRIGRLGLATPLAYGGGIRNADDAGELVQSGAERVCIDSLLAHPDRVRSISALVGAQALIGVMPLSVENSALRWRDHVDGSDGPLPPQTLELFTEQVVSEAMLVDWRHEGSAGAFDNEIVTRFPPIAVPLIAFGGISEDAQFTRLFADVRIAAVGVGNFLNYREHAIQSIKRRVAAPSLRPASYR